MKNSPCSRSVCWSASSRLPATSRTTSSGLCTLPPAGIAAASIRARRASASPARIRFLIEQVVVEGREDGDRGIVDCLLHTNGDEAERLWTKAGGSAFRPYFHPDMFHSGDYVPVVEGRKVYALAVTFMPKVTFEILERNGLTIDDLDLVIMHQANLRINEGVQKRLELPD